MTQNTSSSPKGDIIRDLPVMPLRNMVMFPRSVMPFFVGRESSIAAIDKANASPSKQIYLVAQRHSDVELPEPRDLYATGVVCKILQLLRLPDGTVKILCEGLYRAAWLEMRQEGSFNVADVERLRNIQSRPEEKEALTRGVHEALEEYAKNIIRISQEALLSIMSYGEPGALADAIMPHMKIDFVKKQSVLELLDEMDRLERVYELLEEELALATIEKRIKNRVKVQMERNQRDYYLTEQLKAINREMGRDDDPQADAAAVEQKIHSRNLPAEARDKALEEVRKLRIMQPSTAEYAVVRGYIDWILDLPWLDLKPIEIDMARARHILDSEHYGLEKAKERILEYLAVQKLSGGLKGPILCFVGPPGVGKTSLAKSVAAATGRDFMRLSLGGVRDEAEIRGHRRTYVGALPGKIIQSLKRAKFNNPLFCLDEIDKIASDYRGDPASALLEVLDPEQNDSFMDHYLDLEYDLSRIFFITTANSLHTIPPPLLDRMEIIEIPSYLETEKRHIARQFLLPRQIEANGLKPDNLSLSENALTDIIRNYTRESGVRNLEREIGSICRKTAMRIVEGDDPHKNVSVSSRNLSDFLGLRKYRHEEKEKEPRVGVCAGMAYNQKGGEILLVETSIMNGSGNIVTTGQLGDVMTESAKAALSWVRSRSNALGLTPDFYKKIDIHVHVPSGSTPKDGPSAGITLATSITSAVLGIPVRNEIAMTGEISLRGRVLPIGGLREKLLAAARSGIKTVIMPRDNEKDLVDVPEEILQELHVIFVDHIDDVLPHALAAPPGELFAGTDQDLPLSLSLRKSP